MNNNNRPIQTTLYLLISICIFVVSCSSVWRSIKTHIIPIKIVGQENGLVLMKFTIDTPSAKTVHLAGGFNNWTAPGAAYSKNPRNRPIPLYKDADTGFWTVIIALPEGSYSYKYIINGTQWVNGK